MRVVRRTAEGIHRDVDVALQVPRTDGVDAVLQRRLRGTDRLVVGVRLGPPGHHGVVLVEQVLDLPHPVHDVALDVPGGVELGLLAQVADREAGREARLAGEAVVEAGHDPEQARLPGAVRPDDADLGARVERDRDVFQHRPVGRVVPGKLVRGIDELSRHGPPRVPAAATSDVRVGLGWGHDTIGPRRPTRRPCYALGVHAAFLGWLSDAGTQWPHEVIRDPPQPGWRPVPATAITWSPWVRTSLTTMPLSRKVSTSM